MTNRTNRAVGRRVRSSGDKERQVKLVRIIGERMMAAREQCNMTQSEAARRLGYKNSAKLSKIEHASDTNSVPLYIIVGAAKLYGVTVEYLFGGLDTFGPSRQSEWIKETWELMRQRDIEVMRLLDERVSKVEQSISDFAACSLRFQSALDRFLEINPRFKDMNGAAGLQIALERFGDEVKHASKKANTFT